MFAISHLNRHPIQPELRADLVLDRSALFQRHDWVWLSPSRINLSKVDASQHEAVKSWLHAGAAVVTRRSSDDVANSILRLGVCLPNERAGKPSRIALSCNESDVISHRPALLLDEIQQTLQEHLTEPWVNVLRALSRLQARFGIPIRIYGSLAWQTQHQGKSIFIRERSDLDLLVDFPLDASESTQRGMLQALQDLSDQSESQGGPHIDGELRHAQLGDVSWQEWLQVSQLSSTPKTNHIRILSKLPSSVKLVSLDIQDKNPSNKLFSFDPKQLDEWAISALTAEAMAWPKPGLVSPVDSGSHEDMDIQLLLAAISSLRLWFYEFARAAQAGAAFKDLAAIGRAAEAVMMRATDGVNVYRGAIFNLGLLVSSAAISSDASDVPCLVARRWGPSILLHRAPNSYHGEQLRARLGTGGALQEAASGFPTLTQYVLPAFLQAKARGYSEERALIAGLMLSIQNLEDTNLLWRGGPKGLAWAQQQAVAFHREGGVNREDWRQVLTQIHSRFIERRLSPGGSADIASCALFLSRLAEPKVSA